MHRHSQVYRHTHTAATHDSDNNSHRRDEQTSGQRAMLTGENSTEMKQKKKNLDPDLM